MGKRLLLVSNSTSHGSGYLDHCEGEIRGFLGTARRILFVPFAMHDRDEYAARTRARMARMDCALDSLHEAEDPRETIRRAQAIFVGGGNTFRLLRSLYDLDVLEAIRERVESATPYVGSSAGTNVACPTIETTNDMPIVQPPTFDALGLVPFQVNPHYFDPDPHSTHAGETREQRIRELHEETDVRVVGLREGSMLRIEWPHVELRGLAGARLFERGREPVEHAPGSALDFLLR